MWQIQWNANGNNNVIILVIGTQSYQRYYYETMEESNGKQDIVRVCCAVLVCLLN